MTFDEDLLAAVDAVVSALKTTRSAFTREALRKALRDYEIQRLEEKHRIGYERLPVTEGEFDVWEDEQAWGD